ncbi:methyltransferase, TIGR04325 family [Jannaschia seohaensis]|uniref:Putative methyltransferase (TIGR04325 family) n=1 Tax=Jannaschia seohaensis TaxID=475081 RepID=A0A2Y9C3V0_9RHOB|nr:methyltransferase, TIGR04325 family [Jannaschia seohaensis]PWJ22175.1 putative methyltransferase (TIGR04325 family) [Jannaschia seohaensis]SSA38453.1 putative methyltransferase, LIC12133 family [Jannaschia seohaensis]
MRAALGRALRTGGLAGAAILARARVRLGLAPRFSGVWDTREAALAALPAAEARGYDDPDIAEVSFEAMCNREVWDYPVLHWLSRWLPDAPRLLDAGGHMGTKRIALGALLPLEGVTWTVLDTPGIVTAARAAQAAGRIPADLSFVDAPERAPETDLLLASGLMQYVDRSLTEVIAALPAPPRHLLLNKVALRDGPQIVTHERLDAVRVPYRIRARADWQAELDRLGYDLVDTWRIPDLSHRIPTHPWLGMSQSWGFALTQRQK